MGKKMILVGMLGRNAALRFMDTVLDSLSYEKVDIIYIDYNRIRFRTNHTEVWFIYPFADRIDGLDGIRADAIFGQPFTELLACAQYSENAVIAYRDKIGLVDYICRVEREASMYVGDMWPRTYITTSGIGGSDEFRKRWLNSIYGKGALDGLRQMYVAIDETPEHKDESLYNRAIIMAGRRNGKSLLSVELTRKIFEHAEKAGVLKPTIRKIPEIAQEDIDRMLQPAFDTTGFIQSQIYNALMKGENYMSTEGERYVRHDIASLAEAFKRINDAFNKKFPGIKNVIFSGPCTIVLWEDGTKTIVRCEKDVLDPEKGLAMAIAKKALGTNKSGSNYYDIFKKWLPKEEEPIVIDYATEAKEWPVEEVDASCQE